MAKRKRCAYCRTDLRNKQYHQVYDEKQKRMVYVCADPYSCYKPYAKKIALPG